MLTNAPTAVHLLAVKEIREFFGVMASHQLKRGTYATASKYTPDAQAFAKANGINEESWSDSN